MLLDNGASAEEVSFFGDFYDLFGRLSLTRFLFSRGGLFKEIEFFDSEDVVGFREA